MTCWITCTVCSSTQGWPCCASWGAFLLTPAVKRGYMTYHNFPDSLKASCLISSDHAHQQGVSIRIAVWFWVVLFLHTILCKLCVKMLWCVKSQEISETCKPDTSKRTMACAITFPPLILMFDVDIMWSSWPVFECFYLLCCSHGPVDDGLMDNHNIHPGTVKMAWDWCRPRRFCSNGSGRKWPQNVLHSNVPQ